LFPPGRPSACRTHFEGIGIGRKFIGGEESAQLSTHSQGVKNKISNVLAVEGGGLTEEMKETPGGESESRKTVPAGIKRKRKGGGVPRKNAQRGIRRRPLQDRERMGAKSSSSSLLKRGKVGEGRSGDRKAKTDKKRGAEETELLL